MPKRSSNKDVNQLAASILDSVTKSAKETPQKNPAAVALGRLGGLKGGKARAKKLTKKQMVKIAKKGAEARWGKKE
ncbi:MAG: hypothetical protein ACUZ8E_04120 [Candidatus Anammoxibacter sp.]